MSERAFQKRYRRKRDANQPEIVKALKKMGIIVYEIDEPCDLLCWDGLFWHPVEVKVPRGGSLTYQQKNMPFLQVVRSVEDVQELVHEWNSDPRRRRYQPV